MRRRVAAGLLWAAGHAADAAVWSEDFEGDASAWQLDPGWTIADCGADRCLRLDVSAVPWPGMATATLTTPIPLDGVVAAGLSIDSVAGKTGGGSTPDVIEVQRSTDGGLRWEAIVRGADGDLPDLAGLALNPAGEPSAQIRFVFRQAGWSEVASVTWQLDDLAVDAQPLALLSPQGGVELAGGAAIDVRWGVDVAVAPLSFDLDLVTEAGTTPIAVGLAPDLRAWPWVVPDTAYAALELRLTAHTASGDLVAGALRPTRVVTTSPGPFSLTAPVEGQIVGGQPALRWDVSPGADLYSLVIDGDVAAEVAYRGVTARLAWTPPGILAAGPHTWTVIAADWAGHTLAAQARTFQAAPEPPAPFALTAPPDGAWVRRDVALTWEATSDDDAGVSGYDLYLDDQLCQADLPAARAVLSRVVSPCSPDAGAHTWRVVARDGYGNPRRSSPDAGWSFQMDAAPPAAFDAWFPDPGWSADPQPWLSWGAPADVGAGLARFDVVVDGQNAASLGPDATTWQVTPPLLAGVHEVFVIAVDGAGNTTASSVAQAWIDDVPPSPFAIRDPIGCAAAPEPTLCWDAASDAHAGVAGYELWVDDVAVDAALPPDAACATPTLTEGVHRWWVVAVDGAGQRTLSDVGTVAIAGPTTPEVCDGLDTDCDGVIPSDERDLDDDGLSACAGDCDDADPQIRPGAAERCDGLDDDCDGAPDPTEVDADGDRSPQCGGDCDDADPTRHPRAAERCNGLDDDCDGDVPAGEADRDVDGARACDGDCDDRDAARRPGLPERCDGQDNDCDGVVPADERDADRDGYRACLDCDDSRFAARPGAPELCNGVDDDCDGSLPAAEADADADGARTCDGDCDDQDPARSPGRAEACDGVDNGCDGVVPPEELDGDGDGARACAECDDADPAIFPGAAERCNALDDDCDGAPGPTEVDADRDGVAACEADCDDADPSRAPGHAERCDGADNDCDGVTPAGEVDADGDGRRCADDCDETDADVFAGAPERCNGADDDCDALTPDDEADADQDGLATCAGDCDDLRADVLPGAAEVCDGVDNDCDLATPDCPTDTAVDTVARETAVDTPSVDTPTVDTPEVDTPAGDTDADTVGGGDDKDGGIRKKTCGCASADPRGWAWVGLVLVWRRSRPRP